MDSGAAVFQWRLNVPLRSSVSMSEAVRSREEAPDGSAVAPLSAGHLDRGTGRPGKGVVVGDGRGVAPLSSGHLDGGKGSPVKPPRVAFRLERCDFGAVGSRLGPRVIPLNAGSRVVVGRDGNCDIVLVDQDRKEHGMASFISRRHAQIRVGRAGGRDAATIKAFVRSNAGPQKGASMSLQL